MRKIYMIAILCLVAMVGVSAVVQADNDNHEKVGVCHATGNGGWVAVEVDRDAWDEHNSAHSDHEDDFLIDDQHPCPPEDDGDGGDDNGRELVDICHLTGNDWEAISVAQDAVDAHLGHGDFLIDETHPCPPGEEPEETPEATEVPRVVSTPAPAPLPALPQVTVWSNLPATGVAWQVFASGSWHDVRDRSGNLIVTPIEYRDRFNRGLGELEEDVTMSRLVLGRGASTDPANYRAFDPATGLIIGVWVEFRDEHCQPEDFGSGAVCGTSRQVIDAGESAH